MSQAYHRGLGPGTATADQGVVRRVDYSYGAVWPCHPDGRDIRHGRYREFDLPPQKRVVREVDVQRLIDEAAAGVCLHPVHRGLDEPDDVLVVIVAVYAEVVFDFAQGGRIDRRGQ